MYEACWNRLKAVAEDRLEDGDYLIPLPALLLFMEYLVKNEKAKVEKYQSVMRGSKDA